MLVSNIRWAKIGVTQHCKEVINNLLQFFGTLEGLLPPPGPSPARPPRAPRPWHLARARAAGRGAGTARGGRRRGAGRGGRGRGPWPPQMLPQVPWPQGHDEKTVNVS